jgi:hypothetical protein
VEPRWQRAVSNSPSSSLWGILSPLNPLQESVFSLGWQACCGSPVQLSPLLFSSRPHSGIWGGGIPAPEYPNEESRTDTGFCVQWRASLSRCSTGRSVACCRSVARLHCRLRRSVGRKPEGSGPLGRPRRKHLFLWGGVVGGEGKGPGAWALSSRLGDGHEADVGYPHNRLCRPIGL